MSGKNRVRRGTYTHRQLAHFRFISNNTQMLILISINHLKRKCIQFLTKCSRTLINGVSCFKAFSSSIISAQVSIFRAI